MIGVVVAARHGQRRVLGLSIAARALLALQAAGAERIRVLGEDKETLLRFAHTDTRVRIPVEIADDWPTGITLVVGDGIAVDVQFLRALAQHPGEARVVNTDGEVIAARTRLAGQDLQTLPPGDVFQPTGVSVAVRNRDDERRARYALLSSLRKPQDGWISRAINRRISLAITRVLVWTPVRPNMLSLAIAMVGLSGGWLASRGTETALAWGGVLFQLQSILDGCDGELSRLTFRGSRMGEWLDTLGDDLTNYGFFFGASVGLHAMGMGTLPLVVGGIGVSAGVIASGIEYRYLYRIGSGDLLKYPLGFGSDAEPVPSASWVTRWLGAVRPAFKRDFFVFVTMMASLLGARTMLAMLVLFASGAVLTLGAVLASEVRRARCPERKEKSGTKV